MRFAGEIALRSCLRGFGPGLAWTPVGGIRDKVLAAHRAGITRVLLPARNRRDLEDIPGEARDALEFHWLETVDEALALAFQGV